MKNIYILLLSVILVCCKREPKEYLGKSLPIATPTEAAVSFDWLLGRWERVGEEPGKATYEFWEKVSDTEYTGFGFTLQDQDTIWQENMRLKRTKDSWALLVQSPEDPEAVVFSMTESSPSAFTCENSKLEFPKKIQYWKGASGIEAKVSGEDLEIPFAFKPILK